MGADLAYIARQSRPAPFSLKHVFLGPWLTEDGMLAAAEEHSMSYSRPDDLPRAAARLLSGGAIITRMSGPMEYGLRAPHNRGLLYQAQGVDLQAKLNTSFNMHGVPMVATADDACRSFVRAGLDYLILGPFLATRA